MEKLKNNEKANIETKEILKKIIPKTNVCNCLPVLIAFCFIQYQIINIEFPPKKNNLVNGIFFGVLTTPNCSRQQVAYDLWMKQVSMMYPHSVAFICDEGPYIPGVKYIKKNQSEWNLVFGHKNGWEADKDRAMKRYIGARYFLEHTNLKWYWCASDDNIIDYDKIDAMAYDLDTTYDTENDYVYKGHCIYNYIRYRTYLQGGIGYLYSRKAARKFVRMGMEYIKDTCDMDDIFFDRYIGDFHLGHRNISTRYMFGHGYELNFYNLSYFDTVPTCPNETARPNTACYGNDLYPLKDLVGFHESNVKNGLVHFKLLKKAGNLCKDLYYYFDILHLYVCRGNYTNITSTVDTYNRRFKTFHP